MGGIFGKNKRLRVFPKTVILYKAKGQKTPEAAPVFCDASTWTGENHFRSARIGRTPKGPEISAAEPVFNTPESESAAQAKQDTGEQVAPAQLREAPVSVTARDAQDVEVSQDHEAKPSTEVIQHQEPAEQTKQEGQSARRNTQESNEAEAGLHRAGSCRSNEQLTCEDHEVSPLTQTVVKAEVHMSADVQSGLGKDQSIMESELLTAAEQEAATVHALEETCAEKTLQEAPVQDAADSTAALCTTKESELPWRAAESGEGIVNVQQSAEEQAVEEQGSCAAKAPADLQLEQDIEVPITKDVEENSFEPEQVEEMAEVCGDGQTSKESPYCLAETQAALQDKEVKDSNEGKPEEH